MPEDNKDSGEKSIAEENNYTLPTSQQDLLDRDTNRLGPKAVGGRSYAVEGNEGGDYLGVSPEYAAYANDVDRPYRSEGGLEAAGEQAAYDSAAALANPTPPAAESEGEDKSDDEKSDDEPKPKVSTTTHEAAPAAPSATPKKSTPPKA